MIQLSAIVNGKLIKCTYAIRKLTQDMNVGSKLTNCVCATVIS